MWNFVMLGVFFVLLGVVAYIGLYLYLKLQAEMDRVISREIDKHKSREREAGSNSGTGRGDSQ